MPGVSSEQQAMEQEGFGLLSSLSFHFTSTDSSMKVHSFFPLSKSCQHHVASILIDVWHEYEVVESGEFVWLSSLGFWAVFQVHSPASSWPF